MSSKRSASPARLPGPAGSVSVTATQLDRLVPRVQPVLGLAFEAVRSIALAARALPQIADHLATIRSSVESLDGEVARMRSAVEAMGRDVVGMREAVQPLVGRLAEVSRSVHPLQRAVERFGRMARRGTIDPGDGPTG